MKTSNYRRALFQAKQDFARCLEQSQKLDRKMARLNALISNLEELSAETIRKRADTDTKQVILAHLEMGITEFTRVILKEKFFPMTAGQLKQELEARKLDLSRYTNPLAVIYTVLKRLVKNGEVRIVPQKFGKKAYQWITTTDRLLSELHQSGQPTKEDDDNSGMHK
jgi:hypothetical protein